MCFASVVFAPSAAVHYLICQSSRHASRVYALVCISICARMCGSLRVWLSVRKRVYVLAPSARPCQRVGRQLARLAVAVPVPFCVGGFWFTCCRVLLNTLKLYKGIAYMCASIRTHIHAYVWFVACLLACRYARLLLGFLRAARSTRCVILASLKMASLDACCVGHFCCTCCRALLATHKLYTGVACTCIAIHTKI